MSMGDGDFVEESQGEKDMFQLGEDSWADYQDRFVPLENQLINDLSTLQRTKPQARGRAGAEVRQSFDENYDKVSATNTRRGADPSSGSAMMGLNDASVAEAKLQTRATTSSDQAVDDAYYGGQRQVMSMGQGVRSDSAGLTSVGAGLSANANNIQAQSKAYGKNAMYGAAGTVIGAGGRRYMESKKPRLDETKVDKT